MNQSYAIIGAAMAVHSALGPGFHEVIYHQAMTIEFESRGIPARTEVRLPVYYNGRQLGATYRVDFLCYDAIVVELKALASLGVLSSPVTQLPEGHRLSPGTLAQLWRGET